MQFRHAKESRDLNRLRYEGFKVGTSVILFLTLSSIVPVYNKIVFNGLAGDEGFPYPATTAFLQLLFCAIVLTMIDVSSHFWRNMTKTKRNRQRMEKFNLNEEEFATAQMILKEEEHEKRQIDSWIFGPNFWFKLKLIFPIGALFGLKYGVTNWGLKLLNVDTHVLLQATDLMWTVLFAHLVNREKLNCKEICACLGSTVGTMLIAYRAYNAKQTTENNDGLLAIMVNLTSPILLGLCITTLRKASHRLLVQEASCPESKTRNMSVYELSAIKLWISSIVIFPFTSFENDFAPFGLPGHPSGTSMTAYQCARHENPALGLAAIGGGFFVLMFQVNMTWLSKMSTAVSVGIIGGIKIIPQWFFAIIFRQNLDLDVLNVLGALCLIVSSLAWTWLRYDPKITHSGTPDYRLKLLMRPNRRSSANSYGALLREDLSAAVTTTTPTSTSDSLTQETAPIA